MREQSTVNWSYRFKCSTESDATTYKEAWKGADSDPTKAVVALGHLLIITVTAIWVQKNDIRYNCRGWKWSQCTKRLIKWLYLPTEIAEQQRDDQRLQYYLKQHEQRARTHSTHHQDNLIEGYISAICCMLMMQLIHTMVATSQILYLSGPTKVRDWVACRKVDRIIAWRTKPNTSNVEASRVCQYLFEHGTSFISPVASYDQQSLIDSIMWERSRCK